MNYSLYELSPLVNIPYEVIIGWDKTKGSDLYVPDSLVSLNKRVAFIPLYLAIIL